VTANAANSPTSHGGACVEAREPHRRCRRVEEAGEPSEAAPVVAVLGDAHHTPLVSDDRWSHAEGDHVGEAVVFLAKEGLGVRQARDAAIERVEDHRGEHRHARMIEVLVDGCDHRVEAREQAAGGEQVRQQVDALAALSRVVLGFGGHGRTLTGAILSAKMRNVPTP